MVHCTILPLREIGREDFNLNEIFVMDQYWADGEAFNVLSKPKATHSLLYFQGCAGHYELASGKELEAPRGSIVFIPRGSQYRTIFTGGKEGNISTTLINFQMSDSFGKEMALAPEVCVLLHHLN